MNVGDVLGVSVKSKGDVDKFKDYKAGSKAVKK